MLIKTLRKREKVYVTVSTCLFVCLYGWLARYTFGRASTGATRRTITDGFDHKTKTPGTLFNALGYNFGTDVGGGSVHAATVFKIMCYCYADFFPSFCVRVLPVTLLDTRPPGTRSSIPDTLERAQLCCWVLHLCRPLISASTPALYAKICP